MATKRILLTRPWDGHAAGTVVEEADFTVDSMVRKGYGREITARENREREKSAAEAEAKREAEAEVPEGKGPQVETAMAPPAGETEDARPQIGGGGKVS